MLIFVQLASAHAMVPDIYWKFLKPPTPKTNSWFYKPKEEVQIKLKAKNIFCENFPTSWRSSITRNKTNSKSMYTK